MASRLRSSSVGAQPRPKKLFTSRAESAAAAALDVRCACQFFQSTSLLPERINPVGSRPSSSLGYYSRPTSRNQEHDQHIFEPDIPRSPGAECDDDPNHELGGSEFSFGVVVGETDYYAESVSSRPNSPILRHEHLPQDEEEEIEQTEGALYGASSQLSLNQSMNQRPLKQKDPSTSILLQRRSSQKSLDHGLTQKDPSTSILLQRRASQKSIDNVGIKQRDPSSSSLVQRRMNISKSNLNENSTEFQPISTIISKEPINAHKTVIRGPYPGEAYPNVYDISPTRADPVPEPVEPKTFGIGIVDLMSLGTSLVQSRKLRYTERSNEDLRGRSRKPKKRNDKDKDKLLIPTLDSKNKKDDSDDPSNGPSNGNVNIQNNQNPSNDYIQSYLPPSDNQENISPKDNSIIPERNLNETENTTNYMQNIIKPTISIKTTALSNVYSDETPPSSPLVYIGQNIYIEDFPKLPIEEKPSTQAKPSTSIEANPSTGAKLLTEAKLSTEVKPLTEAKPPIEENPLIEEKPAKRKGFFSKTPSKSLEDGDVEVVNYHETSVDRKSLDRKSVDRSIGRKDSAVLSNTANTLISTLIMNDLLTETILPPKPEPIELPPKQELSIKQETPSHVIYTKQRDPSQSSLLRKRYSVDKEPEPAQSQTPTFIKQRDPSQSSLLRKRYSESIERSTQNTQNVQGSQQSLQSNILRQKDPATSTLLQKRRHMSRASLHERSHSQDTYSPSEKITKTVSFEYDKQLMTGAYDTFGGTAANTKAEVVQRMTKMSNDMRDKMDWIERTYNMR